MKIILRESSDSSKYELFQRLNTGGSKLSDQELRNVILIMVNPGAFEWIEDLAKDENFRACVVLSERLMDERYDLELVTRFLVFRSIENNRLRSIGDLGDFLTDTIVELTDPDRLEQTQSIEEEAFRFTFASLASSLGDSSFRRYDVDKQRHLGPFLISAFEPIALGLGYNYAKYCGRRSAALDELSDRVKGLWANEQFLERTGAGVRASTRIPSNIPLGRDLFRP